MSLVSVTMPRTCLGDILAITVSLDMERNILISFTSVILTREMKIKGSLLQEVKVLDKSYFIVTFSDADFICGD